MAKQVSIQTKFGHRGVGGTLGNGGTFLNGRLAVAYRGTLMYGQLVSSEGHKSGWMA